MGRLSSSSLALLLAAAAFGTDLEVGQASLGDMAALAVRDSRGGGVVFLKSGPALGRGALDLVAARLMKEYGIERASLVVACGQDGSGEAEQAFQAAAAALGQLKAARLDSGALKPFVDGELPSVVLGGPVRTAFRVIPPPPALQTRADTPPPSSSLQAVRFGHALTLLVAGGEVPPVKGKEPLILLHGCGLLPAPPSAAVHDLLRRVGRPF